MNYDYVTDKWGLTLSLCLGEFFYKFIVDDEWLCSDNDPKLTDIEGNINNFVVVS